MPDSLEQLKTDAAETLARGMNCDRLVLRAIGLGIDTRAQIKEAIGFDYGAIEKALERENAQIRSNQRGPVERFVLAGSNGNGVPKGPAFNPRSEDKPEPEAMSITDADRRSAQKAGVSLDAPNIQAPTETAIAAPTDFESKSTGGRPRIQIDKDRAKELRAKGKTLREVAETLDVSFWTLRDHIAQDYELRTAMEEGRREFVDRREAKKKESVSPVGYIGEKPEPSSAPKISVAKDRVAEVLNADPEAVMGAIYQAEARMTEEILSAPDHALVATERHAKIKVRFGEILLECDTPEEAASLIERMRPRAPMAKTVKRAWSRDFESDNTEDGTVGLTYLYLVSMLHDGMEEHEKDAVWTLIKYLKRMQANAEMEKELGTKNN